MTKHIHVHVNDSSAGEEKRLAAQAAAELRSVAGKSLGKLADEAEDASVRKTANEAYDMVIKATSMLASIR